MAHFLITQPNQIQIQSTLKQLCKQKDYTVLYFYPKDSTSWCTTEAQGFTDLMPQFASINSQVIGVSKDGHESHCKFQTKYGLTIPLVSDTDLVLLQDPRFDVWKEKSMYGRKYMGVIRKSFLFDKHANIIYTRDKVKPAFHPKEVLDYIQELVTKNNN